MTAWDHIPCPNANKRPPDIPAILENKFFVFTSILCSLFSLTSNRSFPDLLISKVIIPHAKAPENAENPEILINCQD